MGFYALKYRDERVRKSFMGPKSRTDEFYGFILGKRSILVIDSYLNDNAFTVVKRDAKF